MVTLEQKINVILEWIANDDPDRSEELRLKAKEALAQPSSEVNVCISEDVVDEMIYGLFKEIGIIPNHKGYNQAFTAVKLGVKDPDCLHAMVKRIYADVAIAHNTDPTCVERNIRRTKEAIFNRGNSDRITELFGNIISVKSGNITNSEFIACCVNEITRRIKNIRESRM